MTHTSVQFTQGGPTNHHLYKGQTHTNSAFNCITDFQLPESNLLYLTYKVRLSFKTITKVKYWREISYL